jgi:hypothetical protein
VEPDRCRREGDEDDPRRFDPAEDMVALVQLRRGRRPSLCLIG